MSWRSNKKQPWRAVQEPWEARVPVYFCPKCGQNIDKMVDKIAEHYDGIAHQVGNEVRVAYLIAGCCIGAAFTLLTLWAI